MDMFEPGQTVLVYRATYDNAPYLGVVERCTKTQVILKSGGRYRADGHTPGGGVGAGYITEATKEEIATVRERMERSRLQQAITKRLSEGLPLATLRKIAELLD